jgi:two-component system OmpR family sensor kinase
VRSFRATLTLWYTVALAAAVLAFGTTITVLQRRASVEAQWTRIAQLSDRVALLVGPKAPPPSATPPAPITLLPNEVQNQLDLVPGIVLLVDSSGNRVYGSPDLQRLSQDARAVLRARVIVMLRAGGARLAVELDNADYRFVARRVGGAGQLVFAVAVGEPAVAPEIEMQRLATSLLVVLPVILALAVLVGWLLAGRALGPVRRIIDELEDITDGRSLHRRLPAPGAQDLDEVGRLANALNGLLARLEKSFAAMRRFVADASHELKTPLTVMRAGVERALTDAETSPGALAPLEDTLEGVRYMTELVDTLLTLARVDEGRLELHTEQVDLGGLLREVFETAQLLGEEAGVGVALELPEAPVVVAADGGRIRQLVMNLVTNAVKYTPAGGSVWLTLTGTPAAATISVRDSGVGIAPGDVGRVFDRFWRADPARSRTGERPGIGLGLAISKWIAEAHGGSIGVTSRPGRGSTFTVTLPRPEPAAGAVMESSSSGHSADTGEG